MEQTGYSECVPGARRTDGKGLACQRVLLLWVQEEGRLSVEEENETCSSALGPLQSPRAAITVSLSTGIHCSALIHSAGKS